MTSTDVQGYLGLWHHRNGNGYSAFSEDGWNFGDALGLGSCSAPYFGDYPSGFYFGGACKNHDFCYETCGRKKASCDDGFYYDLIKKCNTYHPLLRANCYIWAVNYYLAVKNLGKTKYDAAQKKACKKGICE